MTMVGQDMLNEPTGVRIEFPTITTPPTIHGGFIGPEICRDESISLLSTPLKSNSLYHKIMDCLQIQDQHFKERLIYSHMTIDEN